MKFGQLDYRESHYLLLVDQIVALGGQHGLNKVSSIGENQPGKDYGLSSSFKRVYDASAAPLSWRIPRLIAGYLLDDEDLEDGLPAKKLILCLCFDCVEETVNCTFCELSHRG